MGTNEITSGIGYSPLSDRIFMGRQNSKKSMWVGKKKDITNQFIDCSFHYFEENTIRTITVEKAKHLFIHLKISDSAIDSVIKKLQLLKSKNKKR